MKKEKNEMTAKRKEIIKNLSITISKESKKVNGRNIKLIETLQKILDKAKRQAYLLLLIQQLLIQVSRLKHTEEPREFQIRIIDSLSRYSNEELDKAIKR